MKFVMLTDIKTSNLRVVLHQIWANLYVEYVTRNPISPVEHPKGVGVNNELFEMGLDRFVVRFFSTLAYCTVELSNNAARLKSSTHDPDHFLHPSLIPPWLSIDVPGALYPDRPAWSCTNRDRKYVLVCPEAPEALFSASRSHSSRYHS